MLFERLTLITVLDVNHVFVLDLCKGRTHRHSIASRAAKHPNTTDWPDCRGGPAGRVYLCYAVRVHLLLLIEFRERA